MTNAEHIVSWAENSQPHWKKLCKLATLGNYIGTIDRFTAASALAAQTFKDMRRANDAPSIYDENDIAQAVVLMLQWRQDGSN